MMMETQTVTMVEVQTEHLLKVVGCDQEVMRTHQTHAHTETTTMVGIRMTLIIQLNALHIELTVIELVQRNEMMVIVQMEMADQATAIQ